MENLGSGILVVSNNREQYPCPVAPVGALQMDAELKRLGEKTYFLDLCFTEDFEKLLIAKLKEFRPEVVVVSIRNIDNETFLKPKFYLEEVKEIIELCRHYSASKIVLGGIGFTVNPKEIFSYLNADYGVTGSNFEALRLLIRCIKKGKEGIKDIKQINGILFWEGGEPRFNEAILKNIQCMRFDWNYILQTCDPKYYSFKRDNSHPPVFGLRTKTGCAFKCIHCTIPRIEGNDIRYVPVKDIIETLKLMVTKFGISRLFITDNVFNYPYEQAINLCREICNQNINIKWTCYMHPKTIDRELIKTMVKAGCESVQFGIDTASDKLLKKWKKGFCSKDLIRAARICNEENLRPFYSLTFGGWQETPETIEESLEILKEAKAGFVWGAYGVRVYPDTELADLVYENGIFNKSDNLLYPKFYLSPHIEKTGLEVIEKFKKNNPQMTVKVNAGDS